MIGETREREVEEGKGGEDEGTQYWEERSVLGNIIIKVLECSLFELRLKNGKSGSARECSIKIV